MNEYFWAVERYNKQDYIIDDNELDVSLIKDMEDNYFIHKIAYNQNQINKSMCTIISWAWILSNYYNTVFSKDILLGLVEAARRDKPPFQNWRWWFIYKAVDLDRNYWNNTHEDKIITYRVVLGSEKFYELLKKWYHIQTWYRWNMLYNLDVKDDCKLNSIDYVKNPTYWHSIYLWMKDNKIYVINSYKWTKCNVYEIVDFKERKNIFFKFWYVYIPKKNIMTEKLPAHIDPKVVDVKRRWIVLTWELEISKAIDEWYKPSYNDYVNWNITDLITKMLIDLNNVRQWLWKQ